jgi:hypothetical protein
MIETGARRAALAADPRRWRAPARYGATGSSIALAAPGWW